MKSATERYDVQTRLAVGSAGLVYRAVDRQTGFPVVLKLLMSSDEFTHRFDLEALWRETSRLRKISGPHVAQLLDAVDDGEGPVLVYQFIDGESADVLPTGRRIEKSEAIDLAAQFLAALECAEKTNTPHGDWKPSNIVIGKSDLGRTYVLVLDWGLAAFRGDPTPDSLLFLSPERLLGEPPSFRADLFSAGAVLYFLLSGRTLVEGADRSSVAAAWRQARPEKLKELRPDLPVKFVDWVVWLMDVRPKKRPANVAEARRALAAFGPPPPPMAPKHLAWRPDGAAFECASGIRVRTARFAPIAATTPRPVPPRLVPRIPAPRNEEFRIPIPVPAPAAGVAGRPPGKQRLQWLIPGLAAILAGALAARGLQCVSRRHRDAPFPKAILAKVAPSPRQERPERAETAIAGTAAIVPPTTPWADYDVGNPHARGKAEYDRVSKRWTILAGGMDIWDRADQFHLVSHEVTGDGTLEVQVVRIQKTDVWAKAGLMFRSGREPFAANVALVATAAMGVSFQWRSADHAETLFHPHQGVGAPVKLKLERKGDTFTGWMSGDGQRWTKIDTQTVSLPAKAEAGYCVTPHHPTALTSAVLAE